MSVRPVSRPGLLLKDRTGKQSNFVEGFHGLFRFEVKRLKVKVKQR